MTKSTAIATFLAGATMLTLGLAVPGMHWVARLAAGVVVGGLFCLWAWNRDRPAGLHQDAAPADEAGEDR